VLVVNRFAGHTRRTVAVGIGLDDGEYSAPGGAVAYLLKVVAQRGDVDERARRARHE
jgi:hypothetical protein